MSEAATVPLASLWTAMTPRRAAVVAAPDVGAIAAAAEAQGQVAGRAAAAADLEPLRTTLAAAVAALEAARAIDAAALQPVFADLVTRIAEAVVAGELRQSGDAVARLVAEALAAVTAGPPVLWLSPGDAARLASEISAHVDPELADGEVRVETPEHVVAASLPARLAAIVAGLA